MRRTLRGLGFSGAVALAVACSASSKQAVFDNGTDTGAGGASTDTLTGTDTGSGAGGDIGLGGHFGQGGSTGTSTGAQCNSGPNDDADKDGFTVADGDCNDCDPNVNPGAIDAPAAADGGLGYTDNDCSGKAEPPQPCDDGLAPNEADPMKAARAVDLCKVAKGPKDWGLVAAKWVLPDGSPAAGQPDFDLGHGVLATFGTGGVKPQGGKRLLALSSGAARNPTDPDYQDVGGFDKGYTSSHPQGFPKESPACPGVTTGEPHDGAALEVEVRVPKNAHGFSFDFNFFTYEWPDFTCSMFNDFFVALLSPIPKGQSDGNISFDSQGNPVSVNNAFVEVCGCDPSPPCMAGGKTFTCSLGDKSLAGTGFGLDTSFQDHGSTEWLVTAAPVEPGSTIKLRWGVYDSGDGILDTTTLVDHWQWEATPGTTVDVGTKPVPTPQ